jgi:hypothetical protein
VARVLRENGFDPGPKRGHGTWHDFVQRHIKTLWATDFFTKTVWTVRGPVTFCFPASPITRNSTTEFRRTSAPQGGLQAAAS